MELSLNASRGSIPFFNNWVGAWAMYEPNFNQLREQLSQLNVNLHLAGLQEHRQEALDRAEGCFSTTQEGIGIINIDGPLMKHASSFSDSCSTVLVRKELNQMARDPAILGIMLKIDSPGGTVAGTKELADAIASANAKKPVMAYCSDLTASAAYWLASQCGTIDASETTLVGSIGTYMVASDSSSAAEKLGIKVHVVRAGDFKGMGTPGTEITEDQLAEIQRNVYGLNQFFLDAVSSGRKMEMSEVSKLADGRVHLAGEAKKLGLIDNVCSFEASFERFVSSVSTVTPGSRAVSTIEESDMSTENTVKPATLAEINSKFPKATSDWKLACLSGGFTLSQCTESYCEILQLEAEAANKRAEAAERKAAKPGVNPLRGPRSEDPMKKDPNCTEDGDADEEDMVEEDDAVAAWNMAVSKELKACGGNRQRAVSQANRKNPGLRDAMVSQVNAQRKHVRR